MSDLEEAVRAEIVRLHAYFGEWFAGRARPDTLNAQVLDALAPDITFIDPRGRRLDHADLGAMFAGAHGANAALRFAVRDVRLLRTDAETLLATYEEWQHAGPRGSRTARLSTVMMTRAEPFRWLHVQETWLPDTVRDAGDFDF